jgi:xanthine dehydrogenase YagR molybdenum-binding subunit
MTGQLETRAVGAPLQRLDGPEKVTGTAPYAYEHRLPNPAYVHAVQSTIARGRVASVDAAAAEALDGVLTVLTHENAPRLADHDDAELDVLQTDAVGFRGQVVAAVVAESPEVAADAAALVTVDYDEQPHDVELRADRDDLYAPDKVNPRFATDTAEGDVDTAIAAAAVTVDETYTTPLEHNNPMEPHATVAVAADGGFTLFDSTQGVHAVRAVVARLFGLDVERVRVISPHVGGGFGSKGMPHAHVVLACLAARAIEGRPAKLALTRQQMFPLAGHRTPTIQRVQLAAGADGRLDAIVHDVIEHTSRIKEFAEQTATPTRMMYAAPNRRTTHRLAALDVPVPTWMRAPGECPGMFGPEVAMDELAVACGLDPIELRIRNDPDVDPETGNPWSSRDLVGCLREGAERFGWEDRDPAPGARAQDGRLVGTGVASSVYPVYRMRAAASIRLGDDGRHAVRIGAADIGTGTWTTLTQIAADALDVGIEAVRLEIGDTNLPSASVAGGSSGITTWGSAIVAAAEAFRAAHGAGPEPGAQAGGETPQNPDQKSFAMYAFGAQFAEVRVDPDTGEIRLTRLLGVFDAGRIINPRTARSQLIGGMTMGLSMALHETGVMDPHTGHVVNHDLAEYHIAAHADVPSVEVHWRDGHDPHTNPMGSKGIGEIGIVGTAAAIANATYHATGIRVRDLPITADRLLR